MRPEDISHIKLVTFFRCVILMFKSHCLGWENCPLPLPGGSIRVEVGENVKATCPDSK